MLENINVYIKNNKKYKILIFHEIIMDLFEISAECEQVQHLENFFRKRISISNSK